jgi:hypothetical protein
MTVMSVVLMALSSVAGLWAEYSFWRLVRREQLRSAGWEYGGWNGGADLAHAERKAAKMYGGL